MLTEWRGYQPLQSIKDPADPGSMDFNTKHILLFVSDDLEFREILADGRENTSHIRLDPENKIY